MKITIEMARSIAQDRANDNAKKHGRTIWNKQDFNFAVREFEKLTKEANCGN